MAVHHRNTRPSVAQLSESARIVLYARVSTSGGHQDPEMQLREYSERRGWHIFETYVDNGVSGSKESRPAMNKMMADAHQRRFDAVVVWKLDRFGRSLRHLVNALADLESLGIAFVSLKDNLHLSTPSGRLMFQIIGAMAEFERALIRERIRAGLRNARAKRKQLGRPRARVNESRVAALRASGVSWREIAKQLGVGVGAVYRIAGLA